MVKYRLVFSDYDDTLTLPDGAITPRTTAAIKAYRDAGGIFVVCIAVKEEVVLLLACTAVLVSDGIGVVRKGSSMIYLSEGERLTVRA